MNLFFLDESGDLGKKGSHHFIITLLAINSNEYKKFRYINKRVRRNKFKKLLKNKKEIKGYLASDELIFYIFQKLENINFKAYSIVLNKRSNEYIELLSNNNINEIYLNMIIQLLKNSDLNDNFTLKIDTFLPKKTAKLFFDQISEGLDAKYKMF